jgi:hypothetical protein
MILPNLFGSNVHFLIYLCELVNFFQNIAQVIIHNSLYEFITLSTMRLVNVRYSDQLTDYLTNDTLLNAIRNFLKGRNCSSLEQSYITNSELFTKFGIKSCN